MDLRIAVLSVCVLLVTLVADTLAKTVGHTGLLTEQDIQTWRCTCDVLNGDSKVLHSYSDTGLPSDLAWQGFSVHDQCKAIRHFCRDQCSKRVALSSPVDGKALGYLLCTTHGQPTHADAGIQLYTQATLYSGGEHCHPTQPLKSVVLKDKLCCGHTSITVNDKAILAFGWNPDCAARMYVID